MKHPIISTLEIHFLFLKNEFREGTYTPSWGFRLFTVVTLCVFIDTMAFTDGVTNEMRQFSAVDALSALKMSVGDMSPSLDLDLDGDGQITSNDARLLLQKLVGKASADPIGQEGTISQTETNISDNQNASGGIDNSPQPVAVTPPPLPTTELIPQAETSAAPQTLGYQLYFDGKLVSGPDAKNYSYEQALQNCTYSMQGKPGIGIRCAYEGKIFSERPALSTTEPIPQTETSAAPSTLSYIPGSTPPQPQFAPRPVSGSWSGYWTNSLGEKGTESLILEESGNGEINGTWSGNILVTGKRISAATIALQGQTQRRAYKVQGTIQGNKLTWL